MRKLLKRRLLWLTALIALLAMAFLLTLCKEDRITMQNYDRIRDGATPADIRAILGREWSDSLLEPAMPLKGEFCGLRLDDTHFQDFEGAHLVHQFIWVGNRYIIVVSYTDDWKIEDKLISDITSEPRKPILDRLRTKVRSLLP